MRVTVGRVDGRSNVPEFLTWVSGGDDDGRPGTRRRYRVPVQNGLRRIEVMRDFRSSGAESDRDATLFRSSLTGFERGTYIRWVHEPDHGRVRGFLGVDGGGPASRAGPWSSVYRGGQKAVFTVKTAGSAGVHVLPDPMAQAKQRTKISGFGSLVTWRMAATSKVVIGSALSRPARYRPPLGRKRSRGDLGAALAALAHGSLCGDWRRTR